MSKKSDQVSTSLNLLDKSKIRHWITDNIHSDATEQSVELLLILTYLSDDYDTLYYVNSNSGEYRMISRNEEFNLKINSKLVTGGNFFSDININLQKVIFPEDIKALEALTDRDNMEKAFGTGDTFIIEYRLIIDNVPVWYSLKSVKISDESANAFYAVGVKRIEEEKKRQQEIDFSKTFCDFLLKSYISAYYISLEDNSWIALKRASVIAENYPIIPDYTVTLKRYMNDVVHPDDREVFSVLMKPEEIKSRLKEAQNFIFTIRVERDTELIVRCEVIRGTDESHFALGFVDITDEMQNQQRRLLGAIPLSFDILTKANIGLWSFELDEGKEPRMYVDEAMLGLIGLEQQVSPEETYHAWYDNIDKDAYGIVSDAVEKMISGEHAEVQYPWHHPDGHTLIVRCGGVRNWKYTSGVRIEGTHQDVTEVLHFDEAETKRQMEKEHILANQQRHLKSFGDMVNASMWRIDINDSNEIVYVNWSDEFRHMLGFDSGTDDFPNVIESWSSRLYPEDRDRALENLENSFQSRNYDGFVYDIEYRVIRKSGEPCWYHAVGRMEDLGGGIRSLYGIFFDISADKLLEEQRRQLAEALSMAEAANRAKTIFLNNMSHDIRTPMNAIIGYTGLAASHIDNKTQVQDYLSKISQSSDHLLSLINDVLDMSRIESGKMNLSEKEENLSDIIHTLRNIVQGDIRSKQLDFYVDAVDVNDENIFCDKLRLNQVLLNILSNAIKYTPAGGTVAMRVTEKAVKPSGLATYVFCIKDNGMGMSKEFLKTIYDPFTRVKSSTVSGIQGTGLGMAISKSIIDMMGGSIEIVSEPGKGTEVTIEFQFKLQTTHEVPSAIPELKGVRALVVDDDSNTCISITKMIRDIGMRDEWCTSGKEAVIRASEATQIGDGFKLYVIDWLMPDMNGIETTRRIRKVIGDEAPIIILTAYDWSDVEDEAKEAGVTSFISKPLFPSDLNKVLSKCFGHDNPEVSEDHTPDIDFSGKKVLLVEDNLINREISTEILEEEGFIVESAEDGDIAVDMLRDLGEDYYDVVLMDIQMPRMDGYEATRAIREMYPDSTLPIIALSANAFAEDKTASIASGMNDHIAKPINLPELFGALSRYLKK